MPKFVLWNIGAPNPVSGCKPWRRLDAYGNKGVNSQWSMVNGGLVNGQWWMVKTRTFYSFFDAVVGLIDQQPNLAVLQSIAEMTPTGL